MKALAIAFALAALLPACGKKSKPLGDKKVACDNIYTTFASHQDKKVWADACNAAPDEVVRCLQLGMEEGKDDACAKNTNNPERSKLVPILNGSPAAAPAGGSDSGSAAAPAGSAAADKPADGSAAPTAAAGGGDMPAECNDYKAAMDKLMACDKAKAAAGAMKSGFDTMWKSLTDAPAASRAAMAPGCKSAAESIATTMKAMGC